jgi:uncharacterized membrane protein
MAEQGLHKINSLKQKWIGYQLLANAGLGCSSFMLVAVSVFTLVAAGCFMVVAPGFCVANGLYCFI